MAVLGTPRSQRERLILVINRKEGGGSNICSSSCCHMTRSQAFLAAAHTANTGRQVFGSRLRAVTQWVPSFRHRHKQIVVFINSCCGDAPTHAD